jgi:hypothetical protein
VSSIPITKIGHIRNAFKKWDNMLPRAGGGRIVLK